MLAAKMESFFLTPSHLVKKEANTSEEEKKSYVSDKNITLLLIVQNRCRQ